MTNLQTRRQVLTTLAFGSLAGILPLRQAQAAEPPTEITTVRLAKFPVICFAPQYVCEELLRAEGFSDIRYLDTDGSAIPHDLGRGKFDFATSLAMQHIVGIDAGAPITIVSDVHAGCYELFAQPGVRGVAYLAFPPENQELHARKAGHVILRTAVDRPWSQYFCCMLAANRDYAARYPVATKRVIRAVLKAADLCAGEPEAAARLIVEGGFTERYDYALQTLTENPYGAWREYDAEDTLRFYALRLHELGMIKSSPQKIIANGTDWRFLNEVKRELKA